MKYMNLALLVLTPLFRRGQINQNNKHNKIIPYSINASGNISGSDDVSYFRDKIFSSDYHDKNYFLIEGAQKPLVLPLPDFFTANEIDGNFLMILTEDNITSNFSGNYKGLNKKLPLIAVLYRNLLNKPALLSGEYTDFKKSLSSSRNFKQ